MNETNNSHKTVRLCHTADNHLRRSHLGTTAMSETFRKGFRAAIHKTIEVNGDALLICGDLLQSLTPTVEDMMCLQDLHKELVDARIPAYLIVGNHDYVIPHWGELLQRGYGEETGCGFIVLHNEARTVNGVRIFGSNAQSRDELITQLDEFSDVDDKPHVIMWHGMVKEFGDFGEEEKMSIYDFPDWVRFAALGDLHITDYRKNQRNGMVIGYPGSTEMCEASESPDKSIGVIDMTPEGVSAYTTEPIETRTYLNIKVRNAEDLEKAVLKIQRHEDENPVIMAEYVDDVENALPRLKSATAKPHIFRYRRVPAEVARHEASNTGAEEITDLKTPEIIMNELYQLRGAAHDMARALLRPEVDIHAELDNYMKRRKAELGIDD